MAPRKKTAGRRSRTATRGGVPENAIARYEAGGPVEVFAGGDPLAERLRHALVAADASVQASSLGRYQLSQITLTCTLKAGFVVLDVGGALALTWTVPKPGA